MANRKLIVEIVGDSRSVEKAFRNSEKAATGFGHKMRNVGIGIAAVLGTAAVAGTGIGIAFGAKAVKAAMSLQESIRRVNVVFGKSAGNIREWGARAALALGMSEDHALEAAGAIGLLLRNMNYTPRSAAAMSKRMVTLSADMAALNKASPEDTLKALQRGLSGQMRGLKQYGIVLSNADVKAEALRITHKKSAADLTTAEMTQARYNLILRKSANTQGFFAKHARTLNELFPIMRAELHNLTEQFGQGLLPVVRKAALALSTKLADPKFRRFVQRLGHDVGVTLYNAFVNVSKWFQKNWPQILQFLRSARHVLLQIAHAIRTISSAFGKVKGFFDKVAGWAGFGSGNASLGNALAMQIMRSNMSPAQKIATLQKAGITVNGDINVHGVQDPKKLSDAIVRHSKNKSSQTRGRHGGPKHQ